MFFEESDRLSGVSSDNNESCEENLFEKYGFEELSYKRLKRAKAIDNSYMVYSDPTNFENVIFESITHAIRDGKIKSPHKIINTHSRIPDILVAEDLEEVAADDVVETAENAALSETQPSTEEVPETPETPATESEQPQQEPESDNESDTQKS
ncbi:MAG: hypothetical protein COV35_07390 [Alphaproteobacteria bacterium CG11_big_fil_rev_8_21_14_0_20_39_49]|nr:MAG: hypothetical protein COV35_07390 [Alphaproteobacteria bacterium CG11_big_fil_rev_8_21_14_0_20_39_49]